MKSSQTVGWLILTDDGKAEHIGGIDQGAWTPMPPANGSQRLYRTKSEAEADIAIFHRVYTRWFFHSCEVRYDT